MQEDGTTIERIRALVRDVELSEPLPVIAPTDPQGRRVDLAWLLVRYHTEPLGFAVLEMPDAGLVPEQLGVAILAAVEEPLRQRVNAAGGEVGSAVPAAGITTPSESAFLASRRSVLQNAPEMTVVVCTREHPGPLERCLCSLLAQDYPWFRVLVVDNAPESSATADVVKAVSAVSPVPVEYLVEPRPGLSHARNAAVAAAPGEILAWIDDDEIADRHWLSELARAFAEHPRSDAVSGVVVPAELDTDAQAWFEQFGGHSKGRGFTPAVFSPANADRFNALYPLPPFGVGANMAFKPGVIEGIGGFDVALGAGTPAMGGEDTLAFTKVLLAGGTTVYQPSAVTRHFHRRNLESLRRQLRGYGVGLTAFYTSLIMNSPGTIVPLMRLVPRALRDIIGTADSPRVATIEADFPAEVLKANRRGMAYGPVAYVRGRRLARRGRDGGSLR